MTSEQIEKEGAEHPEINRFLPEDFYRIFPVPRIGDSFTQIHPHYNKPWMGSVSRSQQIKNKRIRARI